jgi:hypothetical protein
MAPEEDVTVKHRVATKDCVVRRNNERMTLLKRTTASLNLYLATSAVRLTGERHPRDLLNDAELGRADPEVRFVYLYALCIAWFLLFPVLAVALTGLGALAAFLGGHEGNAISIRVLYFSTAFCIVGGLDAAWRTWLVEGARRRYRRNARTLDKRSWRLMKIAEFDDGTLLLQLAIGLASAVTLR